MIEATILAAWGLSLVAAFALGIAFTCSPLTGLSPDVFAADRRTIALTFSVVSGVIAAIAVTLLLAG